MELSNILKTDVIPQMKNLLKNQNLTEKSIISEFRLENKFLEQLVDEIQKVVLFLFFFFDNYQFFTI
jgi:hypothetical protein